MRMKLAAVACLLVGGLVLESWGAPLSAAEKTFFDKHLADIVKIEPSRMDSPAVTKVFAAPIYKVTIEMDQGGGTMTQELIAMKLGSKLVSASTPGTDKELPDFPKMLSPDFRLKSDADGKALQSALDALYPIIGDDDKKAEKFTHSGNHWTFVRGKFFEKNMGFEFTTDGEGKITAAKYVLKLP